MQLPSFTLGPQALSPYFGHKPKVKVPKRGNLHVHNVVSKIIKYTPRGNTLFVNVVKLT
jgi:hypothetical protein